MKEKLLNNLGLKVAALILAFGVWMAVVNISDPIVNDSQLVTVEVQNKEALEASNLTYEIDGKDVITVSYQVRTRDRSLIKASDFHAYVDLNDYNVTGAVPVTVEINKDKESLVKSDTITAKPMVLRIKTEELQSKKFELQVSTTGTTEEGYVPGVISLSPDSVTVEGPESLIGQISWMGVEISVDNANADFSSTTSPIFYDANGNKLELGDKVTVNREDIQYNALIQKAKNIALNYEVSGEVAKGYRYTGVESDVTSIPVVGTKSVLESLSTLTISSDKLNVDGATADKEVQLDLSQYLPPSTSIVGEQYKNVTVKLKVEPLTTKVFTINLTDVSKKGEVADYDYSYDKETTDVTVKGLKEDLDTLSEESLNAVIDVTGQNPGSHPGSLQLQLSEGLEIVGYTPFNVTVTHKNPETTTAAAATTTTTAAAESTTTAASSAAPTTAAEESQQ